MHYVDLISFFTLVYFLDKKRVTCLVYHYSIYMKTILFTLTLAILMTLSAQETNYDLNDLSINEYIDGTLFHPKEKENPNLVIIIPDYGPTDRNGNQNFQKNNALKKLAHHLSTNNIATFRYDKRTLKLIKNNNSSTVTFEDFVTDAKAVISYFKETGRYSKIYIIGHGQGSLVGMLSIDGQVDGFISLAGSGKNIGDVIYEQINATARQFAEDTKRVISSLKKGKTTTDFPPALASMFSLDVQPFMISWMAHNPTEEIKKLTIPILVINGTKDLQVSEEETKMLANANENAKLHLIEKMNHVLFTITGDNLENSKSYNEAFREINPELISKILSFINSQ